jgi:FdhD protein
MGEGSDPPASTTRTAIEILRVSPDGAWPATRIVPAETPVAISFLGIGYAVMMATPADLEDFGVGFACAERLITSADQVTDISMKPEPPGILLNLELVRECEDSLLRRVRHRVGESSCGICGIENMAQALRPLPRVGAPAASISRSTLFASLETLRDHQPLNAETGAVHAAALFDSAGALVAVREDVGRHNAFDKLIGHGLRTGIDRSNGFALLTARCSYELVEKAALAGIPLLVTISAPTSLAVARAREAGLTLVALARSDAMLVVSDPHGLFG